MLRVLCDVDGLAIVHDVEPLCVAVDGDVLHWVHSSFGSCRRLLTQTNHLVVSVHQEFIDQFVESRVDGDRCGLEVVAITNKHIFSCCFDAADVGVWKRENVLAVRLALVVGEVHLYVRLCWTGLPSFRFEKVRWRASLERRV